MPRRRSGSRGRDRSRSLTPQVDPRIEDFNDDWLTQYSERQWSRYVDLTRYEDRRRWHPDNMPAAGPAPLGHMGRPRIVIVPEGHRLARHAPYGGRVPLSKIYQMDRRTRRRFLDDWSEKRYMDRTGHAYDAFRPAHLSRRVGFQHPWQVMICIRRRQRREVLFALGRGGSGGGRRKKPRRTFYSEVRC